MAIDSTRDVYLTGYTESLDFPTTGGFDTDHGGGLFDAFVTKVSADGSGLVWSSYLGGGAAEVGYGVAVDVGENVYVAGYTGSSDFPASGGFDTTANGGDDVYLAKVAPDGSSLLWASYLGGGGNDYGNDLALDSGANPLVTGTTYSSDFPAGGGFDSALDGMVDAFVAKVASDGSNLLWSSYLGGGVGDNGQGIALDPGGNVYLTGGTDSIDFPTPGGFDTMLDGVADAFVAKLSDDGSGLIWSSYVGGGDNDGARDLAVDDAGNVYVTGFTYSSDFPVPAGFDTTYEPGFSNTFVTRVNALGSSLDWSSYIGGDGDGQDVAVDMARDVYLTGATTDFPTAGGFDTASTGGGEGFVAKIVHCGDGACLDGENPCSCPADCGPDTCGNGCCGATEDVCACPGDCGAGCPDGSLPDPVTDASMEPVPDVGPDVSAEPVPDAARDGPIVDVAIDGTGDVTVTDALSVDAAPDAVVDGPVSEASATSDAVAVPDAADTSPPHDAAIAADVPGESPEVDGCSCRVHGPPTDRSAPWAIALLAAARPLRRALRPRRSRRV